MLTRKGPEITTTKPSGKKKQRKIKLIEKMISKNDIRNSIKSQLRRRTSTVRRVSKLASVERMHELIDQSKCECPICLEIVINPIVTQCGHVHCLKCFEEYSIFNLRCCLCRLQMQPNEVQSALLVQKVIKRYLDSLCRFILPTSQEEINYWCRKGEFEEWQSKRRIDLKVLRAGDNVDIRTEDNMWRRGVIVCFKYEEDEYCVEVKVCIQAEIKHIVVPASYRGLASFGFFTKGFYQRYRTTSYQSKFMESIEIPQIICDFSDESSIMEMREECSKQIEEVNINDLALELFEYQMKEWENVFELS